MADYIAKAPAPTKILVFGPNDKPAEPPAGHVHVNREKGYKETWDGKRWVPIMDDQDARV